MDRLVTRQELREIETFPELARAIEGEREESAPEPVQSVEVLLQATAAS